MDAAVRQQGGGRGPLPFERPGHAQWPPGARDRDFGRRCARWLARSSPRRRLRHRRRHQPGCPAGAVDAPLAALVPGPALPAQLGYGRVRMGRLQRQQVPPDLFPAGLPARAGLRRRLRGGGAVEAAAQQGVRRAGPAGEAGGEEGDAPLRRHGRRSQNRRCRALAPHGWRGRRALRCVGAARLPLSDGHRLPDRRDPARAAPAAAAAACRGGPEGCDQPRRPAQSVGASLPPIMLTFPRSMLYPLLLVFTLGAWTVESNQAIAEDVSRVTVFDEAWSDTRRYFYDKRLLGPEWEAIGDRYRPQAAAAKSDAELSAVINAMLGEIKTSHMKHLTREDPEYYWLADAFARLRPQDYGWWSGGDLVRYPSIGIITRNQANRVFVSGVLDGLPAARAGILVGDEVLSVDGSSFSPV